MDKETRKALLLNNSWMECVPKENIKKHLTNVVNNTLEIIIHIQDIIDTPNKIAIKIATDYINYVISRV